MALRLGVMALRIGDEAPDFTAETTAGELGFHDWLGDHWGMLFSHPGDFTPVCTTELAEVARLKPAFDRRRTRVLSLSADSLASHRQWSREIAAIEGIAPNFPMISDPELEIARAYDMLPAPEARAPGCGEGRGRVAGRAVVLVSPQHRVAAMLSYPLACGRSFTEILRLLDALQLTARHPVATPAGWNAGEAVLAYPAPVGAASPLRRPGDPSVTKPYVQRIRPPS